MSLDLGELGHGADVTEAAQDRGWHDDRVPFEDTTDARVWYVAYGSNLLGARLQIYLDNSGDPTPPADRCAMVLPHRLFFADWTKRWSGGCAFIDPTVDSEANTLVTAWSLTEPQFLSVLSQENGRRTSDADLDLASLDLASLGPGERTLVGDSRYAVVLGCPSPDARPAVTFTTPSLPLPSPTRPSALYVDTIVAGLVEGHGIDDDEARAYVAARIL